MLKRLDFETHNWEGKPGAFEGKGMRHCMRSFTSPNKEEVVL